MRWLGSFVLAALISQQALAAPAPSSSSPGGSGGSEQDYRLGVGDIVKIEVHDETDLTLETQVPSTGTIDYPFIGKIQAAGLTVAQLQGRIIQGLKGDYLVNPDVRVRVVGYRPFFVRGQVRNAGGFPYVLGLTVEKAATIAGGFTDRASLRNIFLIKENTTQDQKVKVGLDSPVSPGDTIIVQESIF
jgi:polysaccharide biosynthesis/export protein VpsN